MVAGIPKQIVALFTDKTGFAVTVTFNVCVVAHSPALGVKTYGPFEVLFTTAGFHVPVIPFGEVVESKGATEPEQKLGIDAKFGTDWGVTVTFKV